MCNAIMLPLQVYYSIIMLLLIIKVYYAAIMRLLLLAGHTLYLVWADPSPSMENTH